MFFISQAVLLYNTAANTPDKIMYIILQGVA